VDSFHEDSYREFSAWQRSETDGSDYPSEPVGDALDLARSMHAKYAPLITQAARLALDLARSSRTSK
jgi:hypothetical protein